MLLRLPDNNRMALLQNLMDGDKRFVRLDLVGEHRLAIFESRRTGQSGNGRDRRGGGTPHTPSYPPRRRPMTCGPRYRRYSSGHVFLDTIFNNRSSNALFKARDCGVLYHIRFGAVSSIEVNYCQLPHSYSPPHIFNSIVKLKKHTNTSGLANINRQIGLRPTTFKPSS